VTSRTRIGTVVSYLPNTLSNDIGGGGLMQPSKSRYESRTWSVAFAALASLLLVGGCQNMQGKPAAPAPAPEVATVNVSMGPVALTTELPGRTSAYRVAEIRPQVNGLIQKRLFTEGSPVTAGQVLYQIDPAPFQAVLNNAKAALAKAEANLQPIRSRAERFKELLPEKAVSQQDYDDAEAALKQTEADIEVGKRRLRQPVSTWAIPGSSPPSPAASVDPT